SIARRACALTFAFALAFGLTGSVKAASARSPSSTGSGPSYTSDVAAGVAFDGTNYLVVWQSDRNAPYRIFGALVSPGGTTLAPGAFLISNQLGEQSAPAVAFDGANYLVTWNAADDIYGARVSPIGHVLDRTAIAISTAANSQAFPALAFDGTNYLVTWQDGRAGGAGPGVYGARVDRSGAVLDPQGIPIAVGSVSASSLAFDRTNFLVVWQDERHGVNNRDIYGARVSPGGVVLDSGGIAISTADS